MNPSRKDALYDEVKSLPSEDRSLFGLALDHEWVLWRTFEPQSEDGRRANVWVWRMPAQFFRLTTGDLEVTTGSGPNMAALMLGLAEGIARGMVGFSFQAHADASCDDPGYLAWLDDQERRLRRAEADAEEQGHW